MPRNWGKLGGVRPIKLLYYLYDKGYDNNQILSYLVRNEGLGKDTAELLLELFDLEKKEFRDIKQNSVGLYIHIPFCPSRCTYCSFVSQSNFYTKDLVEKYVECLIKEVKFTIDYIEEKDIDVFAIYIGGGTPTFLSTNQLERLLCQINDDIKQNTFEFTIEAGRPSTITKEKLEIMRHNSVSRICINPQSMRDKTIKLVNRKHTANDIISAFKVAKNFDFDINMDMIVGLPKEKRKDVIYTLKKIIDLSPQEITVHSLALKRASDLEVLSTSIEKDVYDEITDILHKGSYKEYYLYKQSNTIHNEANIGYTKNKPCLYNMAMINEQYSILSNGAGGITKLLNSNKKFTRFNAPKDVKLYIDNFQQFLERKKRWFKNEQN